ncbi:lysophospholipid acyltransferase family protein [Candidatus Villigracilis saccharophilus]|uniref:lysophospholipid acyltransferase family protein n=1 Tax=Candidatus Villigracilis saccharophilus TaxID=3140684 RepID=UPI003136635D|nr:1-acyl-sn-glycerol-3-phosphate acyltransferase [Anaerolineales bacterium]
MKYKTIRSLVRFVMNIIADVEVVGIDKLPHGNVILAANHLGRLDTAVLIYALEREDLIMAVAEKYKDHPIFGAIGRSVNAIWLNRFEADFSALREILARMQKGGLMVIAPEGTRSKTESLQEGKMGAAFLASKSGYPVLPIALTGTEDRGIISNLKRFRRSKIKAVAGDLFYIEIPKGKGREEAMRSATDEIMCQIAAKLPESYRGFYKDYPRVRELEQK